MINKVDLAVVGGGVSGLLTLQKLLVARLRASPESLGFHKANNLIQRGLNAKSSFSVGRRRLTAVLIDSFDESSPSCRLEYAICIPFTGRRYDPSSSRDIDKLLENAGDTGRRTTSIRLSKRQVVDGRERIELPQRMRRVGWWPDYVGQVTTSAALLNVPLYLQNLKRSIIDLVDGDRAFQITFLNDRVEDCVSLDSFKSLYDEQVDCHEFSHESFTGFKLKLRSYGSLITHHLLLATSFSTNKIQSLAEFPHEVSSGINWQFSCSEAGHDLDIVWHVDHLTFFIVDCKAYVYGVKASDESAEVASMIEVLYGAKGVQLVSEWRGLRSHAKLKQRVYQIRDGIASEILDAQRADRLLERVLQQDLGGLREGDKLPLMAINAGYGRNGFCQV